jgi:hypothetical protein
MNGLTMMLKAFGIELDPAEIEKQIRESAQAAYDLLNSINTRLGNIETQNAAMQNTLNRIERHGIPMFASEEALEKFYGENPGIQTADDFLRLTAIDNQSTVHLITVAFKGVDNNGENETDIKPN